MDPKHAYIALAVLGTVLPIWQFIAVRCRHGSDTARCESHFSPAVGITRMAGDCAGLHSDPTELAGPCGAEDLNGFSDILVVTSS